MSRLSKIAASLSEDQIRGLLKLKKNISKLKALRKERKRLVSQLSRIDRKITKAKGVSISRRGRKKKRFSAATRKKMAKAQKMRWALKKKAKVVAQAGAQPST